MTTPHRRGSVDQRVSPDLDEDAKLKGRPAAIFVMVMVVAAATIITIAFTNPSAHSYAQPVGTPAVTSHMARSMTLGASLLVSH